MQTDGTEGPRTFHRYNSDLARMHEELAMNGTSPSPVDLVSQEPDITAAEPASAKGNWLNVPRQRQTRDSSEDVEAPPPSPAIESLGTPTGAFQTEIRRPRHGWLERKRPQDIEELWFAGNHGDIGGGWTRAENEAWMLSHAPLVWMVYEAERAGLKLDPVKMARLACSHHAIDEFGERYEDVRVSKAFFDNLEDCYCNSVAHDCLTYGGGLSRGSTFFWKIMEYLPFRRMDLEDGKWKTIRWPLPMGETRDIPDDAQIHVSVIQRMQSDPTYRPGNLIVGGGGRGVRTAPKRYGIGEWVTNKWEDDIVRQSYVRKTRSTTGGGSS